VDRRRHRRRDADSVLLQLGVLQRDRLELRRSEQHRVAAGSEHNQRSVPLGKRYRVERHHLGPPEPEHLFSSRSVVVDRLEPDTRRRPGPGLLVHRHGQHLLDRVLVPGVCPPVLAAAGGPGQREPLVRVRTRDGIFALHLLGHRVIHRRKRDRGLVRCLARLHSPRVLAGVLPLVVQFRLQPEPGEGGD